MMLGLGRWTLERVGDRMREVAENVRDMADNLQRAPRLSRPQMPALRVPRMRLPELAAPRRRGPHPVWIGVGAAVGAGIMYLFDPENGRQRRAIVRDKARKYLRLTTEAVDGTSRDMMNRARGLVIELRSRVGARQSDEESERTSSEAR